MSNQRINVLTLAGDPGGAAAIAPVVAALQREKSYRVVSRSYRQATNVFESHELETVELPFSFSVFDFVNLIAAESISVILSATSVNGIDLEKKLFLATKMAGVASIAVLDFWSNYTERFRNEVGRICLPDLIAVPNLRTRREMEDQGFPVERLVVTGQPAFDHLTLMGPTEIRHLRADIRRKLAARDDEIVIVFVSQALTEFYGSLEACNGALGYSERSVLFSLQAAIQLIRRTGKNVRLIVQPHPREDLGKWDDQCDGQNTVANPTNESTLDVCVGSDAVVGMTSVVLYEASLLGLNVLSIEPTIGRQKLQDFESIRVLKSVVPSDISRALLNLGSESRINSGGIQPATPNVIRYLDSLVGSGSSNLCK